MIYDVVIVGGGITGSALLYVLGKYTPLQKILLLEKCPQLAQVNSRKDANSQTLHFGDIETNYSLERAKKVKETAELVQRYVEKHPGLHRLTHKMVLGVGAEEVHTLEQRYQEFKVLFPKLKLLSKEELAQVEPKVVEGRDPDIPLVALYSPHGYAINYEALAKSFVTATPRAEVRLQTKLNHVHKVNEGYQLETSAGIITAKVLIIAASAHSLIFAKRLGYGKQYGILPVAGSFYATPPLLKGKVYMVQIPKLPFAALHGDPDVASQETRFGPTAKVLPVLERGQYRTIPDFLRTSAWSWRGVSSLLKLGSDPTIFRFLLKNVLYDLPFIGKSFFLRDARKIVPSLQRKDLLREIHGGLRPQVVDIEQKKMVMAESKIYGDKSIFIITPSPGATVCLKNAEDDAKRVCEMLHVKFDQKGFDMEFRC